MTTSDRRLLLEIDWLAPGYVRDFYGVPHPLEECESRWCEHCQKFRETWDDICPECGDDT